MNHIHWIEFERLAVRPGPGCEPWDLAELRKAGFLRIISLDVKQGVDPAAIEEQGIEHVHVPLCDDPPDSPKRRAEYFSAIDRVLAVLDADGTVPKQTLVHCYAGIDRSPSVGICYLIAQQHIDPAQAIRQVTAMTGDFEYKECIRMIWEWSKRRVTSAPSTRAD